MAAFRRLVAAVARPAMAAVARPAMARPTEFAMRGFAEAAVQVRQSLAGARAAWGRIPCQTLSRAEDRGPSGRSGAR